MLSGWPFCVTVEAYGALHSAHSSETGLSGDCCHGTSLDYTIDRAVEEHNWVFVSVDPIIVTSACLG